MKKRYLLLGIVVLWMAAYAASVKAESWVMPNTSGGEITITDRKCTLDNGKYKNIKHAYTWTNQVYVEGCWTLIDGNVHIVWSLTGGQVERRVYSISGFNKKENM